MMKRFLPEIAGTLALLLIVELAAFLLIPAPFVERGLYYDASVAWKLEFMDAQPKPVQVLFLGDSTVRNSINPAVFDNDVQTLTGQSVYSFNGGLSAANATITSFYSREVYSLHAHPQAIVYAINIGDVVSQNPVAIGALDAFKASPMESAMQDTSPLSGLNRWLLNHSQVYRLRGTLRHILGDPVSWYDGNTQPFDERGYKADTSNLAQASPGDFKAMDQYFRSLFDHFEIDPAMVAQVNALIEDAQKRGIKVYLVLMPTMPRLLRFLPHGRADYDRFVQTMQEISQRYAVPMLTLDPDHWSDYFSDANYLDYWHMNVTGAPVYCKLIANWYVTVNGAAPESG